MTRDTATVAARRPASGAAAAAAAAIVGALTAAGTRLLTGMPGGGPNLDVVGAAAAAGLPFALAHGETAAAIMAAAGADLTGAPGAVVVTRGPGLASAVNGIAHAALDRLPLIVIADTVPAADADRVSHQRLDQAALGRPVAKAVVTVGSGEPGEAARHAVRLALAPPAGPVIVTMDPTAASTRPDAAAGQEPAADLGPLADALARARRPAVLLGTGAFAHTTAVRAALAGSGIPALHTYRARGILPDSGGEAAGLITGGTMEWPLLAAADLIVGLGVDPAEMIPAAWEYQAATVLVTETAAVPAVTAGPGGDGSWFTGATELVAPLPAALALLGTRAGRHDWPPGTGRRAREQAGRGLRDAATAGPGLLAPQQVAAAARAATPAQVIVTVDAGAHMLAVMPLWEVEEPHRLLISSGLATMGYALPAAIGAALCTPGTPVIAFTGDGGLGMTLMEIETAVRLRLPVIVVVFNDAALSLIRIKQRREGHGGPGAVAYAPVSFAAAAEAMGAAGVTVSTAGDLAAAVTGALTRPGPTVIDTRVDPAAYPAVLDLTRGAAGRRPLL